MSAPTTAAGSEGARAASRGAAPEPAGDAPIADMSDAGLRRIAGPIVFLGVTSALTAIADSAAIAGIAALFSGSLAAADPTLAVGSGSFDALSNPWTVLALVAVTFALNAVNTVARERVVANWEAQRRKDLVRAYREADVEVQRSHSGGALSVTAEQVGQAANVIAGVSGLLNTGLRAVVYLGVALVASPTISLVAIVSGGALVAGLRGLSRRTRVLHRRMAADRARIGEQIDEMTSSSRELHLLNRWADVVADLRRRIATVRHDKYVSGTLASLVGPIYWAGTLLVGLLLAAAVHRSGSNLQDLAASGLLLIRALGAGQAAQVMYQSYNDAVPYQQRVLRTIGELRAARRVGSDRSASTEPTLRLEGVSISYGNDTVVRGVDLEIGGTGGVALVGPSGSGKSTTLLAMSGFLAPSGGTISADGIPLDLLPPRDLGHTIGYLPQDPKLFRATLRDNALRPDTRVDDDELTGMLDRVGLLETVRGFDDGLGSPMGHGGEGFSGGELQRFGLVRLQANQPHVWLLDEPTSALDRRNSERVASVIIDAMRDHLVVLVTHRPELLEHCERLIFMEDGVIVDDGSPAEVARRQPFVAAMLDHGIEPA